MQAEAYFDSAVSYSNFCRSLATVIAPRIVAVIKDDSQAELDRPNQGFAEVLDEIVSGKNDTISTTWGGVSVRVREDPHIEKYLTVRAGKFLAFERARTGRRRAESHAGAHATHLRRRRRHPARARRGDVSPEGGRGPWRPRAAPCAASPCSASHGGAGPRTLIPPGSAFGGQVNTKPSLCSPRLGRLRIHALPRSALRGGVLPGFPMQREARPDGGIPRTDRDDDLAAGDDRVALDLQPAAPSAPRRIPQQPLGCATTPPSHRGG